MHCVLPTTRLLIRPESQRTCLKNGHVPVILSDIIQLFVRLGALLLTSDKKKVSCFFKFCLCPAFLLTESDRKLAFGSLSSHASQSQAVLWPNATAS